MSAHIFDAQAHRALQTLTTCGPVGRELAGLLDSRGTFIFVTHRLVGGFALNFINTIFLSPLPSGASDVAYKAWVSLLAHEAEHIRQGYWIDSVAQELHAYRTQLGVCRELGIALPQLERAFGHLDATSPKDLRIAQDALMHLFPGSPAAIVYAALPLFQPRRLAAFRPGFAELWAVLHAAFHCPPAWQPHSGVPK